MQMMVGQLGTFLLQRSQVSLDLCCRYVAGDSTTGWLRAGSGAPAKTVTLFADGLAGGITTVGHFWAAASLFAAAAAAAAWAARARWSGHGAGSRSHLPGAIAVVASWLLSVRPSAQSTSTRLPLVERVAAMGAVLRV